MTAPVSSQVPVTLYPDGSLRIAGRRFELEEAIHQGCFDYAQKKRLDGWNVRRVKGESTVQFARKSELVRFTFDPTKNAWSRIVDVASKTPTDSPPGEQAEAFQKDIRYDRSWIPFPLPMDIHEKFAMGDVIQGIVFFANGRLQLPPSCSFGKSAPINHVIDNRVSVTREAGHRKLLVFRSHHTDAATLYFSFENGWYQWKKMPSEQVRWLWFACRRLSHQVGIFCDAVIDPLLFWACVVGSLPFWVGAIAWYVVALAVLLGGVYFAWVIFIAAVNALITGDTSFFN